MSEQRERGSVLPNKIINKIAHVQKQKRVLVGHVHRLEKDSTKIVHPLHTMHYKMSTSTKHPKRCQASQLSPHDAFWLLRADLG